jgi:hypothetical protein
MNWKNGRKQRKSSRFREATRLFSETRLPRESVRIASIAPIAQRSIALFLNNSVDMATLEESKKSFKPAEDAPKIQIMKRPSPAPTSPRGGSQSPRPGQGASGNPSSKTLQEREEEYKKARDRIFAESNPHTPVTPEEEQKSNK